MCTCSILCIIMHIIRLICLQLHADLQVHATSYFFRCFCMFSGNKKWYPKCKIAHCGSRWGLAPLIRMYTGLLWFPVLFPLKEQTSTGTITFATVIYLAWVVLLLQPNVVVAPKTYHKITSPWDTLQVGSSTWYSKNYLLCYIFSNAPKGCLLCYWFLPIIPYYALQKI